MGVVEGAGIGAKGPKPHVNITEEQRQLLDKMRLEAEDSAQQLRELPETDVLTAGLPGYSFLIRPRAGSFKSLEEARQQAGIEEEQTLAEQRYLQSIGLPPLATAAALSGGLLYGEVVTELAAGATTVAQHLIPGEQEIERKARELTAKGVDPWMAAIVAYKSSDLPPGVKGAIETFTDPIVGPPLAKLTTKLALKLSKEVAAEAGRAVLGKAKTPTFEAAIEFAPRLADPEGFGVVVEAVTHPDTWARLGRLPGLKQLMSAVTPNGLAATPVDRAVVGLRVAEYRGAVRARGRMAELGAIGTESSIFGPADTLGRLMGGKLKGLTVNDLARFPAKYKALLTDRQAKWLETAVRIDADATELLQRNGIKLVMEKLEVGERFTSRLVVKLGPDGYPLDLGVISRAPRRKAVGAPIYTEFEKVFGSAEQATKYGYKVASYEQTLLYRATQAYRRIAEKDASEWLLARVLKRSLTPNEALVVTREQLRLQQEVSKALLKGLKANSLSATVVDEALRVFPSSEVTDMLTSLRAAVAGRVLEPSGFVKTALAVNLNSALNKSMAALKKEAADASAAIKRVTTLRPTEGKIAAPAFQGWALLKPEAEAIRAALKAARTPAAEGLLEKTLQKAGVVAGISRFFMLAGDFGVGQIQLLPLMVDRPDVWLKHWGIMTRTLVDTTFHAKYLLKHAATIQRNPDLALSFMRGTEFTELFASGRASSNRLVKIIEAPLDPLARSFDSALDFAGIELMEGLEHMATTPARREAVVAFVNEFRGILDERRLGVPGLVRQVENAALFLAPRYNRAIASLLYDTLKGDLRGELARTKLMKVVAGTVLLYVGISEALGQKPVLDPLDPNFALWDVAGQKVGPGSKLLSVAKLVARSAAEPSKLAEFSRENIGLRWMLGNVSPLTSFGYNLLTGKNFIGDPTRDGMLSLTKEVLSHALPIWMQSMLLEGGSIEGRLTRGVGEFFGLRTRPISKWEQWTDYVEKVTETKYDKVAGENRDVLTRLQELDPQGKELYRAWLDDATKGGRLNEASVTESSFRDQWQEAMEAGAEWLAAGKEDKGNVFLEPDLYEWVWSQTGHLAEQLGTLREVPEFKGYYAELKKHETKEGTFNDAWAKYWDVQFDPILDTAFGYDYDRRDENLAQLREQVGEEMWARVLRADRDRWATLPIAIRDVRDARDALRDYYEVDKQLIPLMTATAREKWENYRSTPGEAERNKIYAEEPLVRQVQAAVGQARIVYRRKHPDIDVLLIRYGKVTTPQTMRGLQELQRQRRRVEEGQP